MSRPREARSVARRWLHWDERKEERADILCVMKREGISLFESGFGWVKVGLLVLGSCCRVARQL